MPSLAPFLPPLSLPRTPVQSLPTVTFSLTPTELELSVYCGVILLYLYDILWNIITTMYIHVYGNIEAYF